MVETVGRALHVPERGTKVREVIKVAEAAMVTQRVPERLVHLGALEQCNSFQQVEVGDALTIRIANVNASVLRECAPMVHRSSLTFSGMASI
jgi:hypothetical protein